MLGKVTGKKVDCLVCPARLAMILLTDSEQARWHNYDEQKLFLFCYVTNRLFLTSVSTNIKLTSILCNFLSGWVLHHSFLHSVIKHGNFLTRRFHKVVYVRN